MTLLIAAQGNLFNIGQSLATKLGHLGGAFLVLIVGVVALGLIATHRHAAAVVLILAALVPAWFLFDPSGAAHTLSSTVKSL